MQTVFGIPASAGIGIGRLHILSREARIIREIRLPDAARVRGEVSQFRTAVRKTLSDLASVKKSLMRHLGEDEAKIFDVHQHMLTDASLVGKTIETIERDKCNAAFAFKVVIEGYTQALEEVKDPYLKERATDLKEVYHRVLNHLLQDNTLGSEPGVVNEKVILAAHAITPYEFLHFDPIHLLGVATESGGATSHFSIVARSLKIPAVVGCENIHRQVKSGDLAIIDGNRGCLILNPDRPTTDKYRRLKRRYITRERKLLAYRDLPTRTKDGKTIDLATNVELPSEMDDVLHYGCRNVGLCRTEFLYLMHNRPPTEEEQFQIYKSYLEKMRPGYVILRTFDMGGDKMTPAAGAEVEENPAIGWRAIRVCLDQPDLFRTQLRAILRASVFGHPKIMFPMISSLDELRKTLAVYQRVKRELADEKIAVNPEMEVGIMVEVPSAVLAADSLAREVDFFSIGTNDLTQFMLAVDRGNKKVAHLFDSYHPSVLKAIKLTIDAAHRNGIWAGVCGEMAGHPIFALLLLGMGADELSMHPLSVLEIKRILRGVKFDEVRAIVEEAMEFETSRELGVFLRKKFKGKLESFDTVGSLS